VNPSMPLVTLLVAGGLIAAWGVLRLHARRRRRYLRMRIAPYRTDRATAEAVVGLFDGLHRRLRQRWWRRRLVGQASVTLEAHLLTGPGGTSRAELAVCGPEHKVNAVEAALRSAYPNTQLEPFPAELARPPYVLRLKKRSDFITRLRVPDAREPETPLMDRLLTAMQATGGPCLVQLALTPTPAWFERSAKQQFKRREQRASPERKEGKRPTPTRTSEVDAAALRGALDVQHRPLFFGELRVVAATRTACEDVASVLRTSSAENQLVERGTTIRQALLRPYDRRVRRGEGNSLPGCQHCGRELGDVLACLARVVGERGVALGFRLGLVGGEERVERGLGVHHHELAARQAHEDVRTQSPVVGVHGGLGGEVAVLNHAGHLDDVAKLDLAPRAAGRRASQRGAEAPGLLGQTVHAGEQRTQRLAQAPVGLATLLLDWSTLPSIWPSLSPIGSTIRLISSVRLPSSPAARSWSARRWAAISRVSASPVSLRTPAETAWTSRRSCSRSPRTSSTCASAAASCIRCCSPSVVIRSCRRVTSAS
jgi:hypothetical protein